MAYTMQEGIEQMRDSVLLASDHLQTALLCLGEAHELLDERLAERLEDELFRPVRRAYGEARRTYSELAGAAAPDAPAARSAPSHGAKAFVEDAVQEIAMADTAIAELQDSMLPVEIGDAALRARLTAVRELLGGLPSAARELLRVLGR
jgi:hypothetical protein